MGKEIMDKEIMDKEIMDKEIMDKEFTDEIAKVESYFADQRFQGIRRLYSARQVAEQRGSIKRDYSIAKKASREFFDLLRMKFSEKKAVTTFGPYSTGQAVMMRRQGIQGIYVGGWATSAKGSDTEDPGSDLASYPLSRVPEEAGGIVRALLAADKNQFFARSKMSPKELARTPRIDFRPFLIADADTGHGGDAHVRNLIRRFVENGVTGYHIEDQKPGTKKCGHQGGKVVVPADEQIKRLNAARFQLDVMEVPGIIVARTDSEAATLLETCNDERDHAFVLGVTNLDVPAYKDCSLALLKKFYDGGVKSVNGHLLYRISEDRYKNCDKFFDEVGLSDLIATAVKKAIADDGQGVEKIVDAAQGKVGELWEVRAGIKTFGQAVSDALELQLAEGIKGEMTLAQWQEYIPTVSLKEAMAKARSMGIDLAWDAEPAKTPDGYYQAKGSIEFAIHRSLAVAPYCDIIWMETKTANIKDAREFAHAMHKIYPDKMLAYNLSPSFNWDSTGMSDAEMKAFPEELGKAGFVFNFITYGGHQIDGLAAEEFSHALIQNGMLALAHLQRRLRLLESPYNTPQTLVGGNRMDSALAACSGGTATTVAMGKGSTQFQHLVQTEVSIKVLQKWLDIWRTQHGISEVLTAKLRPLGALSDLMELSILDKSQEKIANVVYANMLDRQGHNVLSIRNQGTRKAEFLQKRLMTIMQSFLAHRYKSASFHYLAPTEDTHRAVSGMVKLGFYSSANSEIGDIIVATVNPIFTQKLLEGDEQIRLLVGSSKTVS
jgi:isocitrate lyase